MRQDPLAYLTTELNALREQGSYWKLRILDSRQQATTQMKLSVGTELGLI